MDGFNYYECLLVQISCLDWNRDSSQYLFTLIKDVIVSLGFFVMDNVKNFLIDI